MRHNQLNIFLSYAEVFIFLLFARKTWMKKLLLLCCGPTAIAVSAQSSPISLHTLSLQGLELTAFVSIPEVLDTTASASIEARDFYIFKAKLKA